MAVDVTKLFVEGLNPVVRYDRFDIKNAKPGDTIRITAVIENNYNMAVVKLEVVIKVNQDAIYRKVITSRFPPLSYFNACAEYKIPGYGDYNICAEVVNVVTATATNPGSQDQNAFELGCPDYS